MQEEEAEKPTEPAESAGPAEAAEPTAEKTEMPTEPVAPKPRAVRLRKPKPAPKASAPSIVMPEIDDKFWATLLRTQREAERATKLQRISEFNVL